MHPVLYKYILAKINPVPLYFLARQPCQANPPHAIDTIAYTMASITAAIITYNFIFFQNIERAKLRLVLWKLIA